MQNLRIIALLLSHPDPELFAARRELVAALCDEPGPSPRTRDELRGWAASSGSLLDAQEEYSATFDGGRRTSLHLFEHVHGDGKERGAALAELSARQAALGFMPSARELPDHLPLLCELAAVAGEPGRRLLEEARPVVELLLENLRARLSPFAWVVRALLEVLADGASTGERAPLAAVTESVPARWAGAPEPNDLEALDREWAEAPVEFGVAAAHEALIPLRRSRDAALLPRRTP